MPRARGLLEARNAPSRTGIEITHEQEWQGGRRSFYFKDPAGNLLEIADGDIWPGSGG